MITPKALEGFGFKKNPRHSKEYNLKKLRVKIIVNRVDLWIGKEFIASLKYVDELEKYL